MEDTRTTETIQPAAWNPRTVTDEDALAELTLSIKAHGVIQPLVVRDIPGVGTELVAGSRRLAAAKRAGLERVPVVVRELTDLEAAELAMAENVQNEAMSPLDESGGYKYLLESGQSLFAVSQALGVPISRVRRRLRLLELKKPVREALAKGTITVGHADRLTRVPAKQQQVALDACVDAHLWGNGRGAQTEPAPLWQLDEWIGRNVKVDLTGDVITDYFPQLLEEQPAVEAEAVPSLLKLSDSHQVNVDLDSRKHGLIGASRWVEVGRRIGSSKPVKDCEHAQEGVVVHGGPVRVLRVCAKPKCPVHRPAVPQAEKSKRATEPTKWEKAAKAHEREREVWEAEQPAVVKAFAEYVADLPVSAELIRKTVSVDRTVDLLTETLDGWTFTDERIGQVLAVDTVSMWSREDFRESARLFGFELPARKRQPAKRKTRAAPAAEAGETGEPPAEPAPTS